MPTPDVHAFVCASLPPRPARVLEIGAGDGTLAAALRDDGYDVLAIDPAGGDGILQVPLHELDAPTHFFAAAVAVTSLHHVDPLDALGRAPRRPAAARRAADRRRVRRRPLRRAGGPLVALA